MKISHGIILTAGVGSRLAPLTNIFNKNMIPIGNRFVIDYSINSIKSIGIENLTVVIGNSHYSQLVSYLQDGSKFGLNINYVFQSKPLGIAHAINSCKNFIHGDQFSVMLADSIFEGNIKFKNVSGAQIVLSNKNELNRFGVASIVGNKIIKLEEKPKVINLNYDNYAIAGCYLFDNYFFDYFKDLKPSPRGEYEATDIIKMYNKDENLSFTILDKPWHDAGTPESLEYLNKLLPTLKII